jgi:hypothetical protein
MAIPTRQKSLHPRWLITIVLAILTSSVPRRTLAQARAARPDSAGQWAVEQQYSERWLHGHQQSRFVPFRDTRQWVLFDSSRGDGTTKRLFLTLGRNGYGRDSALIVVGPTGRVIRLDAGLAQFVRGSILSPGDSVRYEEMRRRGPGSDGVALPETRLWDLVTVAPPQSPRVGLAWTDTIARVASHGAFRQVMHGTRTSRIVGERMIGRRRLWVVHDDAAVTYEERYPERERTLDTTVSVVRRARGAIRGTHLYDPALPLAPQRDDTTSLAGEATLTYPDGRTFSTPARFERTRHWTLLDPAAYASRLAALRSTNARGMGGMVVVPDSPIEKRLAAGDVKVRDSLLAAWRRTTDPNAAAAIFHLLEMWPGSADSREVIERARTASGDTAYLYTRLSRQMERPEPLDTDDVRAMLPFMEDPGLAWSVDLSRDWLYENLAWSLTRHPPAAGEADSPYRSVACAPAACRLLAGQWHSAREPRLRDVGLVALLATDPAQWVDTVLALDGPSHPLLHAAAQLAHGVAATWDAASKAPMPPAGSDWHAWLQWMDGRDPDYIAATRQSSLPPRMRPDTVPRVRFEQSHATAIRFFQARTGRDIVAELRRGYDEASSDSARLVFGTMLQGLGALQSGDEQLVAWFRSGNPTQVALARGMLVPSFAKSARADTTVAIPLLERLLAAIVHSAPLWSHLNDGSGARRSDPATLHTLRGRCFIDTLGLPPRVRSEWNSRVELISQSLWNERDVRSPSVFYRIEPIATWGHFARLQVTATQRYARKPDERPTVYASGSTYWLMNLDGEWVIVAESHWVT